MEAIRTPTKPWYRRLGFRISVRWLIVLVLVIGGGLGWIVHRASVQRDAIRVILGVNGQVEYDWQRSGTSPHKDQCFWPEWLESSLGADYFHDIILVNLVGPDVTDEVLGSVGRLEHLEFLSLNAPNITDAGLARLPGLGRLEFLNIRNGSRMTGDGLKSIGRLTSLKSLVVSRYGWVDDDLAALSGLTKLDSLSLYFLPDSSVNDAGVKHLAPLKKLQSLQLYGSSITTKGLEAFQNLENLNILILREAHISSLEPLAGLRQLATVDVRGNPIGDDGLRACEGWTRLRDLYLQDDRELTDAGLAHLCNLSALRNLDLENTNIGDAGAKYLANCPNLAQLDLWGTKVGDDGIEALANRHSTVSLSLSKSQVSDRGAAILKKPGGKLIWAKK
jgi:hypothetical protein